VAMGTPVGHPMRRTWAPRREKPMTTKLTMADDR
jgi:hypothetical protein